MLTTKTKTIIRWSAIAFIFLGYYFWLALASLSFGHISEKESVLLSGPVSLEYHRAIIENINEATNIVFEAAILGFPICMFLILLIFKKVR
ncbi:hypothetical protein [Aeromonas sp. 1HA1]|uniref:hypothetical protein n=1 Tax=Aeromonas sp. 1HA1 TaxID=2699193 RepID=UPI0023DDABC6|nr:hypothetical protein [Aeromonas sp. 1HA1]MDF2415654.1 hypothetical protein [Aeromonas sp. 1HA1]